MKLPTIFGTLPFGALPAGESAAVADPFRALLRRSDAEFVFLLIAAPYDPAQTRTIAGTVPFGAAPFGAPPPVTVTGGPRMVYLSDRGFKTRPSDTPANQDFPGRLLDPYNFGVEAVPVDGTGTGARSGAGQIVIANADRAQDALLGYGWDGAEIEIRAGAPDFTFDQFATIFRGTAAGLTFDRRTITLALRDRQTIFDVPIGPDTFAGTGGIEGGADLAGKRKPWIFGYATAVEPVLVDAANQVWLVGARQIQAIPRVTDKGVPLTFDGDFADIYAWTPVAGRYATSVARAALRLGSPPLGRVAADVEGDNVGGFVSLPADIVKRIATTLLGINNLSEEDVDGGSIADANAAAPWDIGVYIREGATAREIIDAIMGSVDGWAVFSRAGLLTVGVLPVPATPSRTLTDREILDDSGTGFRLDAIIPPAWRQNVGYNRVWGVHAPADLAQAGVSDADRTLLSNEYRFAEQRATAQRTIHRLARDVAVPTLIFAAGDAAAAALARKAKHGVERRRYTVPAASSLLRYWVGDQIELQRPAFGLDAGKTFVVVAIGEAARLKQTTLTLWG